MSEWGHDFRPDYLRLRPVIEELGRPPVMACTATATPKVADEIVARLGLREPERVRSGFDRPNLSFDVLPFDGEGSVARKRGQLVAGLQMPENRPAVVYCGTRKSTEEIAALLGAAGLSAVAYHAGMGAQARAASQQAFMRGDADVVVATNAFGMGVDKADVRSVWHWALPSSLESYYQEAGRAGRDGAPARAVLLASRSDLGRLVRFIREAEVTVDQVGALVARLAARADERSGGEASRSALELDGAGDDRDRVALSVAEQAGALTLAPGSRGGMRIELSDRGLDAAGGRAAVPGRRQPALGVLPQHRALRGDGRRVPAAPDPRPLRRRDPGARLRPLLRRLRPAGLAAGGDGEAAPRPRAPPRRGAR